MKGLELSEKFFNEYGKPMLERDFISSLPRMAAGLVGHGSECFGFDDDTSRDHDFDAGFCIWITAEDEKEFGFKLFRAYEKLFKTSNAMRAKQKSLFGSDFKGVKTIEGFYGFYTGGKLPKSNREWLSIPDFYLAEATNGKVFFDNLGEFTRIREHLKNGRPEDVRMKKLASALFFMAQAGQYNYSRSLAHGENVAAAIAATDFVKSAMEAAFLLERKYAPYYKWTFRALKGLDGSSDIIAPIEKILSSPYDGNKNAELIESVCSSIAGRLIDDGYTQKKGDYLEAYAYAVNDLIIDGDLRNDPIMM